MRISVNLDSTFHKNHTGRGVRGVAYIKSSAEYPDIKSVALDNKRMVSIFGDAAINLAICEYPTLDAIEFSRIFYNST